MENKHRMGIVGAHHVGAPHKRDRIWIVAELADADNTTSARQRKNGREILLNTKPMGFGGSRCAWWDVDPADIPDTDQQHEELADALLH